MHLHCLGVFRISKSIEYIVYIDESGDSGIKNVRSTNSKGASQYMTMCATIVPRTKQDEILNQLNSIQSMLQAKSLHTRKLSHFQKVYAAREISKIQRRYFGVVSNKQTIGDYGPQIKDNSVKFYNKCSEYLLERVCSFLIENKISAENVSIVFEERNHDYSALIAYISQVRRRPFHTQAKMLKAINPFSISWEKKKKDDLFFLPDFGAHALYQCFNKSSSNYSIPETRYLTELRNVFHRDKATRKIGDHGIKFIQSLSDLDPEPEVSRILDNLKSDS